MRQKPKGPSFIGRHELFDKVADAVEGYVDEIAERMAQLGGVFKQARALPQTISNAIKHRAANHYPRTQTKVRSLI